jgi:hypothetical protein
MYKSQGSHWKTSRKPRPTPQEEEEPTSWWQETPKMLKDLIAGRLKKPHWK